MHTCRIILFTSLVWFLLDVAVLFYYSDSPSSSRENNVPDGNHPVLREPGGILGIQAVEAHPAKREILDDSMKNSVNHFISAGDPKDEEVMVIVCFPHALYNLKIESSN